jgi:hypothetical protein
MRRMIRFASTVVASLSLALIGLATIAGGETKAADGILYCGSLQADPNSPSGVSCSSSCWFTNACSAGFTLQAGSTCSCFYVLPAPDPTDPFNPIGG